MELFATVLLFLTVAVVFTFLGARFWVRPKAAIDRVTLSTAQQASAQVPLHPSLIFHDLVKRLGTLVPQSPKDAGRIERRLIRAGYRGSGALRTFFGSKVVLAALLPLIAALISTQTAAFGDNALAVILGAGIAGFIAPSKFLDFMVKRRQKRIRRALPNALDLMVVCVESGLGLDQAIMQTAKELETAHPEISQEFTLVNLELRAGKRRAEALRNLAERSAVDELKKLVAVLVQADRFGTGIALTLRSHSDYMRVQARQAAEEKAAKLGVKLVFPIFFCILPSLFVVTVGPVMVRISRELLPMMRNI
ncbi:MAG TPA: type II secretion system F family protein [Bryobacteraceae bacterium]|nr:type II secretion system F family protein [Bryobacteraceae bacterium]